MFLCILAAIIPSIIASECDDVMNLYRSLHGYSNPVSFKSPTDCCYYSLFTCAKGDNGFKDPPEILELYIYYY